MSDERKPTRRPIYRYRCRVCNHEGNGFKTSKCPECGCPIDGPVPVLMMSTRDRALLELRKEVREKCSHQG